MLIVQRLLAKLFGPQRSLNYVARNVLSERLEVAAMFWVILAKHHLLCQQGTQTSIADSHPCWVSLFSQSFLTPAGCILLVPFWQCVSPHCSVWEEPWGGDSHTKHELSATPLHARSLCSIVLRVVNNGDNDVWHFWCITHVVQIRA